MCSWGSDDRSSMSEQPAQLALTIWGRANSVNVWRIVEANLSGRRHATGDDFTSADICLGACAHRWFGFVGIDKPFSRRVLTARIANHGPLS